MSVAPERSIETGYGWVVAIASTLMITTAFGAPYAVVVGLKPIAAEFDWPRQVPSAAYALAMLGSGLGGIAIGFWSDRHGMGLPALMGAVTVGSGAIALGFSQGMVTFLGIHFLLIGFLGNATMFSPLLTNITRWFDRRRGIAVAIVASGQSLAGAVWPPIFRYTIETYGWRSTLIAYGCTTIAILLPLSQLMRRRPAYLLAARSLATNTTAPHRHIVLGLAANQVQAMLCLAIVGCCVAMAMPMVHIVAYCSDLGFAAARGAEMLSILLACAFVSRIGYGWLADRIGGLMTLLIGSALQMCGLALYVLIDTLSGLYAVSVFYGLGYGGIVPMYAIIVRELFPDSQAGWRIGILFLFGTMGMAMGGYLGGVIYDLTATYALAFLVGMAFNLGNLLLVGFLVWRAGGGPRLAAAAAS